MSGRGARLQRLLAIRILTEELDRSALRSVLATVAEVAAGLGELENVVAEARRTARSALTDGRSCDWMMADAEGEVAVLNRARMKRLLESRTEAADDAMKKYLESRREHEQVKQLVQNADQAARTEDGRRAQAAADEWFLGKRAPES